MFNITPYFKYVGNPQLQRKTVFLALVKPVTAFALGGQVKNVIV